MQALAASPPSSSSITTTTATTTTAAAAAASASETKRARLPYFDSLAWFQCVACLKWRLADFETAHPYTPYWSCQQRFWSDEYQIWTNACSFHQDKLGITCINPNPLARNYLEPPPTRNTKAVSAAAASAASSAVQVDSNPTVRQSIAERKRAKKDDNAKQQRQQDDPARTAPGPAKPPPPQPFSLQPPFPQQQQFFSYQATAAPSSFQPFYAQLPAASKTSKRNGNGGFDHTRLSRLMDKIGTIVPHDRTWESMRSCANLISDENSSTVLSYNAFEEIKRHLSANPTLVHELCDIMCTHPHYASWTSGTTTTMQ